MLKWGRDEGDEGEQEGDGEGMEGGRLVYSFIEVWMMYNADSRQTLVIVESGFNLAIFLTFISYQGFLFSCLTYPNYSLILSFDFSSLCIRPICTKCVDRSQCK